MSVVPLTPQCTNAAPTWREPDGPFTHYIVVDEDWSASNGHQIYITLCRRGVFGIIPKPNGVVTCLACLAA